MEKWEKRKQNQQKGITREAEHNKIKKLAAKETAKSMRITTMMGTKKGVMMQLNHSNSDNNANR
jgi:hypothetical protein